MQITMNISTTTTKKKLDIFLSSFIGTRLNLWLPNILFIRLCVKEKKVWSFIKPIGLILIWICSKYRYCRPSKRHRARIVNEMKGLKKRDNRRRKSGKGQTCLEIFEYISPFDWEYCRRAFIGWLYTQSTQTIYGVPNNIRSHSVSRIKSRSIEMLGKKKANVNIARLLFIKNPSSLPEEKTKKAVVAFSLKTSPTQCLMF